MLLFKKKMSRRKKHELSSWIVLILFTFIISFNFYVNVWVKDTNEMSKNGSRYLWMSQRPSLKFEHVNRDDSQSVFVAQNFTVKNVLDAPLTLHQQTTPAQQPTIVWPSLEQFNDDRILTQLKYKPNAVAEREISGQTVPVKTILLYNGYKDWGVKPGRQSFIEQKCPVSACSITDSRRQAATANAILFRQDPRFPPYRRPPNQIWILYLLEAPYFTPNLRKFNGHFNWTASYRHDSDIVAPYEKFVKFDAQVLKYRSKPSKNFAAGKTKKVAWFVSNCQASNSRLEYAKALSKYIEVDIYGKCGDKQCPRGKGSCSEMLNKDYKFYLAFENSNCRDYITEKFFFTGLQHDVIPIVMGAAPEDYRRVAPHYSFIHVDEYTGPKQLASYLKQLDENDDLYNEYFKWKGTGEFINTYFWCRVCAMLHDTSRGMTSYGDINQWWRGRDVCIGKHRWGEHPQRGPYISDYYKQAN